MKLIVLKGFWLIEATDKELKEFIELEPYSKSTDDFLDYLLKIYELGEEYEKCTIIKNEIDYRDGLYLRLKDKNFFD